MITLTPKRQLGVRVRSDTADELKRIAAAREMSVNELTEQILVGHLMAIQRGATMNLDEFTSRVDELIAEHTAKVQRMIEGFVGRVINQVYGVKAMLDSVIDTLAPGQKDAYIKRVEALLRTASKTPIQ